MIASYEGEIKGGKKVDVFEVFVSPFQALPPARVRRCSAVFGSSR